ncbi:hypothetical protein [Bryobacter aggregatus]|uniref:hypothetical protein n=1 Tax=Bryobacter aggregatus TaxID=360054 RepID=UPI0012BAD51E
MKNLMREPDVLSICPEIVLVPKRPDWIRRAHLTLLSEIEAEIPIEVVKSIDELACTLDQPTCADSDGSRPGSKYASARTWTNRSSAASASLQTVSWLRSRSRSTSPTESPSGTHKRWQQNSSARTSSRSKGSSRPD